MPGIVIRDGDSFEGALKKFKKQCEKAGTMSEIRKREAYEKPSVKRKRKKASAVKRLSKKGRTFTKPARTEF
jgi:small subunit ribosomal protein S21